MDARSTIQTGLDLVCGEGVQGALSVYYEGVKNLAAICLKDPHFKTLLSGTGFGGVPVFVQVRQDEHSGYYLEHPVPNQKVYRIHRQSVVVTDTSVQWKESFPLLMYLEPTDPPGKVHLWVSSMTHTNLLRGDCGLVLEDSTVVKQDVDGTPKLHLSTKIFSNATCKVLLNYTSEIGLSKSNVQLDSDIAKLEKKYKEGLHGGNIYALHSIPAIPHPDWPEMAQPWSSRTRPGKWPSNSLITDVMEKGCLIVPAGSLLPSVSDQDETEWCLAFPQAFETLFKSLNNVQQKVYFVVRALISPFLTKDRGLTVEHLKTALLWALEEKPQEEWTVEHFNQCIGFVCYKLHKFVKNKNCPHYFIPEWNLFEHVTTESLQPFMEHLYVEFTSNGNDLLMHCPYLPFQHSEGIIGQGDAKESGGRLVGAESSSKDNQDDRESILKSVEISVKASLLMAFDENVKLIVTQAYQKLHQGSVDESISLHKKVLQLLHRSDFEEKGLFQPFSEFLRNSIGYLLFAKATSTKNKMERTYLYTKADECLKESLTMDDTFGMLRYAHFCLTFRRYKETITLSQQVKDNIPDLSPKTPDHQSSFIDENDWDVEVTPKPSKLGSTSTTDWKALTTRIRSRPFSEILWSKWVHKQYRYDMMVSNVVKSTLPEQFHKSSTLLYLQVIGYTLYPICLYDPYVFSCILHALALKAKDAPENACVILEDAQHHCLKLEKISQTEKEIAGYYYIIGNCFLSMGKKERAGESFKRSLGIYPSPRSPARWIMFSERMKDWKKQLKSGLKILVVTSGVALTYSFLEGEVMPSLAQ